MWFINILNDPNDHRVEELVTHKDKAGNCLTPVPQRIRYQDAVFGGCVRKNQVDLCYEVKEWPCHQRDETKPWV